MENRVVGDDSSVSSCVSVDRDKNLDISTNFTTAWSSGPIILCPTFTPTLLHRSLMHPIPWFSRRSRIMCSSPLSWVLHYLLILSNKQIYIHTHRTHAYVCAHARVRVYAPCTIRTRCMVLKKNAVTNRKRKEPTISKIPKNN